MVGKWGHRYIWLRYRTFVRRREIWFLFLCFIAVYWITALISPSNLVDEMDPEQSEHKRRLVLQSYGGTADDSSAPSNRSRASDVVPPPVNSGVISVVDSMWTRVPNSGSKFFVYAAYLEKPTVSVPDTIVRVIGVTKTKKSPPAYCQFHYGPDQSTHSKWVKAKVKIIRENWGLLYTACFVLCLVPSEKNSVPGELPYSVTVSTKNFSDSTTPPSSYSVSPFLRIRLGPEPEATESTEIEVCVKPLYNNYNNVPKFLEFIELYTLLGANHFTFYNSSMGPQVDCVARSYIAEGKVEVLPWKLDVVSQKEIRTEGIFAALNDCLYRTRFAQRKYAAMVDVDEFLMPGNDFEDLRQLLEAVSRSNKDVGCVSFQNAFHYLFWEDDPRSQNLQFKDLITLQKTRRLQTLHKHRVRSKYIVETNRVAEVGNHFVWEFASRRYKTVNLSPTQGLSHHYRVCEFGGEDCIKKASLVDDTAYRYQKELVERVQKKYDDLRSKCLLP